MRLLQGGGELALVGGIFRGHFVVPAGRGRYFLFRQGMEYFHPRDMIGLLKVNFFRWTSVGTKFGRELRSYSVTITHTLFGGTGVAASRRG